MILRQLYDSASGIFSYLLGDPQSRTAILIDPVMDQVMRDFELLQQLDLTLVYIFETGVSPNRLTGSGLLRELSGGENGNAVSFLPSSFHRLSADSYTRDGDIFHFGSNRIEVIEIPGPEQGWACFLVNGTHLFTGETLLVRDVGHTRGEPAAWLYRGIIEKLFTLHDQCRVFPGRQTNGLSSSTIGEEKQFNPILQSIDEEAFVNEMERENDTVKLHAEDFADPEIIEEQVRKAGLLVG